MRLEVPRGLHVVRAVDRSAVGEQQLRMHLPDVVHELRRVPPSVVEADPGEAVRAEHRGARRLEAQVRVQPVRIGVAVEVVARQQPRGPAGGVLSGEECAVVFVRFARAPVRQAGLAPLHAITVAAQDRPQDPLHLRRHHGEDRLSAVEAVAHERRCAFSAGRRPSRTRRRRAAGHQRGGPPGSRRCTRSCARFSFAHPQRPAVQRTRQVQHAWPAHRRRRSPSAAAHPAEGRRRPRPAHGSLRHRRTPARMRPGYGLRRRAAARTTGTNRPALLKSSSPRTTSRRSPSTPATSTDHTSSATSRWCTASMSSRSACRWSAV